MKILILTCAALCACLPLIPLAAEDHDHEHEHEHGHNHGHGPAVELGFATIGAWTVKAERLGEVVAGKEAVIGLKLDPAQPAPAVVRAWIGGEDGRGSVKAKLEAGKIAFHGHLEVPESLPADAKLWVTLQDAAGATTTGSFALMTAK